MEAYHIVAIGSGFATTFFLYEYMRKAPANAKVLVLERGAHIPHAQRVERRMSVEYAGEDVLRRAGDNHKQWTFTIGFGGSSNCWWACTPRLHPSDFKIKSRYGVGRDWPIGYEDLEEDYCNVEEIMQISGDSHNAPYPRSRPYPQPPHRFTDPDRLLSAKYPTLFFHEPTGRPRIATGSRPPCCANALCSLCPADAKFTIENGLAALYADPRIELLTEAEVLDLDLASGVARAVRYRQGGHEKLVKADLVVLGANALFNPFLMLKSGMDDAMIGRGLAEQTSIFVDIDLKGVEGFQGSTSRTGLGYMFYDGEHRRVRGACLIQTCNDPVLRLDPGRWRERLTLKLIVEDLPQDDNRVEIDPSRPTLPRATFKGFSPYSQATIRRAQDLVAEMTAGLPVEKIQPRSQISATEGHIQCTTMMGTDPADSVVDAKLISHRVRNLVVVGASTFPTTAPANPTLTLCALSMYAARRLASSSAT
jgi:choline dehydrogenase-like flavoprotein